MSASSLRLSSQDDVLASAYTIIESLGREKALYLIDRATKEAQLEQARNDPNAFIEYVAQDRYGRYFKQAKFQRMLQNWIPKQGENQSQWLGLIGLPRDHGKTSQLQWRDIWELGRDPTLRLKIVTETDDLGAKVADLIRNAIASNPRVHEVFPNLAPGRPWTGLKFNVSGAALSEREYSVEVVSVTSAGTGGRADIIHFDDVMGPSIVAQPAKLIRIKEHFDELFINLLEPEGRAWYLYTPWHTQDLSAALMQSEAWHKFIYPVYKDLPNGKRVYLWPERWTPKKLEDRRKALRNDRVFARQFLLQPISDEELLFPDPVLAPSMEPDWEYGSDEYREFTADMPKYMGVDVASSLSDKAAYNALITVGVDEQSRLWIVDILRGKWRSHEIHDILYAKWKEYRHRVIVVESNGFQRTIVDQADAKTIRKVPRIDADGRVVVNPETGEIEYNIELDPDGIHYATAVHPFHTTRVNKSSEQIGIRGHAAQIARGQWAVPIKHLVERHGLDPKAPSGVMTWSYTLCDIDPIATWIREHVEYTQDEAGSVYTDTVMASWFVEWAVGNLGLLADLQRAAARQY